MRRKVVSRTPLTTWRPDGSQDLLGREINPTVYNPAEFDKKRAANDPFLKQVLDKPKLFVLGNNNELGKVAGG